MKRGKVHHGKPSLINVNDEVVVRVSYTEKARLTAIAQREGVTVDVLLRRGIRKLLDDTSAVAAEIMRF